MPRKIETPIVGVVVRRFQVTVDLADVALAEAATTKFCEEGQTQFGFSFPLTLPFDSFSP